MPFVDQMRANVQQGRDEPQAEVQGEDKSSSRSRPMGAFVERQGSYTELKVGYNNLDCFETPSFPAGEMRIKGSDANKSVDVQTISAMSQPSPKQAHSIFQRADFQVGGMIGQGSFATVHKAKHLSSGMTIALKVVRPESELDFGTGPNGSTPAVCYKDVLRAMKKEVNLIESLGNHPHIVQVLGTAEDCRVFVMERAVSDLYTIVKQQELRLPLGHAQLWAEHMLAAVAYIHSMGIVHQDIKSSNVLVFANRAAKLCDFGLAKKGSEMMVVDRELVTLWYRAPELIMGDDTYTMKVDEWGVGCVILEMMIGVPPFKGKPECVCSCSQITHRNFNSDQLMKIFQVVGSPDRRCNLACAPHFNRWPQFPQKLESILDRVITADRVPTNGTSVGEEELLQARDNWYLLISSLLSLTPHQRPTALQALEFSVFKDDAHRAEQSSPKMPANRMMSRVAGEGINQSDSPTSHSAIKRHSPPEAAVNNRLSPESASRANKLCGPPRPYDSRRSSLLDNTVHTCTQTAQLEVREPRDRKSMSLDAVEAPARKGSTFMSSIRSKVELFIRAGSSKDSSAANRRESVMGSGTSGKTVAGGKAAIASKAAKSAQGGYARDPSPLHMGVMRRGITGRDEPG